MQPNRSDQPTNPTKPYGRKWTAEQMDWIRRAVDEMTDPHQTVVDPDHENFERLFKAKRAK